MARPRKATVDYFPHYTNHGQTMFIIQNRFKNNGYAVWFKILERLGCSDGHFINSNDGNTWEFLTAYCCVEGDLLREILDLCASLGAIDREFWADGFIFSGNYLDHIKDAYRQRKQEIPTREEVSSVINSYKATVSSVINPQMKVNEMKVNETINTTAKMSLFEIRKRYREMIGQELGGGVNQNLVEICQTYTPECIENALIATSTRLPKPKNPFMYFCKVLEGISDSGQASEAFDINKDYPLDSFYHHYKQSLLVDKAAREANNAS